MRNKKTNSLEHSFIEFADYVLLKIKEHNEKRGMPKIQIYRLHFMDDSAEHRMEENNHYTLLMHNLFSEEIWGCNKAITCIKNHLDAGLLPEDLLPGSEKLFDSNGKQISSPTFSQMLSFRTNLFFKLIFEVIEKFDTLSPTQNQLTDEYRAFVKSINAKSDTERQVTVPLLNFSCEMLNLSFGDMVISSFTAKEKNDLWLFFEDYVSPNTFINSKFKLTGTYVYKYGSPISTDERLLKATIHLLNAFRLCRPGEIATPFFCEHFPESRFGSSAVYLSDSFLLRPSRFEQYKQYELHESDLTLISKLYDIFERREEKGKHDLETALNRFNLSYFRNSDEDKMIDLTIALESCLLSDMSDELQYRLSMRGAALLASKREPSQTKSLLETIYKCRSKIVHDGKNLSDLKGQWENTNSSIRDFMSACEGIVREVLREFVLRLDDPEISLKQLNKELDQFVISSLHVR